MISTEYRAVLTDIERDTLDAHARDAIWRAVVNRSRSSIASVTTRRGLVDAALVTDTATDSASDAWSSEVLEAWARLGHEARYGTGAEAGIHGLSRVFDPLTDDQLLGLTNSVKGTAMEIKVREMAQSGDFPGLEGLSSDARLSTSLTQAGHDVEIVDSAGAVIERIQVKAGSWESIAPRLSEYTDQGIAVAVTSETAARAQAVGFGAAVIDTGISGTDLTEQVRSSVDNLGLAHGVDELLPELAFAAVALSAVLRMKAGQEPAEVAGWVRSEIESTGAANAAGLAAELMTGLTGVRVLAALGTRWGLARRRSAREVIVAVIAARSSLASIRQVAYRPRPERDT